MDGIPNIINKLAIHSKITLPTTILNHVKEQHSSHTNAIPTRTTTLTFESNAREDIKTFTYPDSNGSTDYLVTIVSTSSSF